MPRPQSLKVLQRKIRALQAQAEKMEQVEKPGIAQLRALLTKFKLRPSDVKIALQGRGRKRGASKLIGRKVKPKYRNPSKKTEMWTGRGRMPLWMAALVKKGRKADDFLIRKGG